MSGKDDLRGLVAAINGLEDALAAYFADKDIPMSIRAAVDGVEIALDEAGLFDPVVVSKTRTAKVHE